MDWIKTIVILILMALPSYSEENVSALAIPKFAGTENLVCLLRKQSHEVCKESATDDDKIPLRLKQLYRRMSEKLKEYVKQGSLAKIPPEIFSELSPVIFHLMPNGDNRLDAGGKALARIVRALGGDAAAIIAAANLLHSPEQRDMFISQLSEVNLPEKSQKVLGEFLAEWFVEGDTDWKFDRFSKALKAGNPLVGSLPPPFLTSLTPLIIERFIFLLSRWESKGISREEQWYSKGKVVARTWANMVIKAKYPHVLSEWSTTSYKRYPFLLTGFTPDELLRMAVPHRDVRADLLKLRYEKLQARAVFEVIMKKRDIEKSRDTKKGIPLFTVPILTMLSPVQLSQYFNHSIADFGVLKNPSLKLFAEPSLATARQLAHCLIAQSISKRLHGASNITNEGRNKRQITVNVPVESSVSNVSSQQEVLQSDKELTNVNGSAESSLSSISSIHESTQNGSDQGLASVNGSVESSLSSVSSIHESTQNESDQGLASVNGSVESSLSSVSPIHESTQNESDQGLASVNGSVESSLSSVSSIHESTQNGSDQGLARVNGSVVSSAMNVSSNQGPMQIGSDQGVDNVTEKVESFATVNQPLQNANHGPANTNSSVELLPSNLTSNQEMKKNLSFTINDFINTGHFVYSLSLSYFINNDIEKISSWQLRQMDSRNMRPRQGRLLTKYLKLKLEADPDSHKSENRNMSLHVTPDELLGFGPGLLRGILPTSVITKFDLRRIPQRVIEYILSTDIPWSFGNSHNERESLPRLSILQKIRNNIDQDWVLRSILSNGESSQLLRYLTPQELVPISQPVLKISTFTNLLQLHPKTLSILLDIALPELLLRGPGEGKWASESLVAGALPLLRGLRCHHLGLLDYHDVVVVLGQFNKQRQAGSSAKYQPFPKDLQYCAVKALASHLEAKASLWYEKGEEYLSGKEILNALEDSDVESIGGFVIAGLSMRILQLLGADAVRSIGQLSSHELLSALYKNHDPSDVAILLLKQLGLEASNETEPVSSSDKELNKVSGRLGEKWNEWYRREPSLLPVLFGSLFVYLPPDKVEPSSLKWALETANPGENLACLNAKMRETWYLILKDAFGEPETWTSSTLSIIGDFLITVPKDMLQKIPSASWEEAADSLVEKSRLFHKIIRMPTGIEDYVQVCMKFLEEPEQYTFLNAAKTVARYYLLASQMQMNGITMYSDLLRNSSQDNKGGDSQDTKIQLRDSKKPSGSENPAEQTSSQEEGLNDRLMGSKWSFAHKITCEAVQAVGPEISGASLKLEDIELMSPQEVWDCVDVLGSIDLDEEILNKVWMQIKNTSQGLELQDLGKVVRVLSDEDLMKFNISISSNLDDVYTLGRQLPDWNKITQWANKILPNEPDRELTAEEVAALGGLVCGISDSLGNKTLTPQVILQAAPFLAEAFAGLRDIGCPPKQCIETLGRLAAAGLGDPADGWTAMELETVDILAAGFTEEIWRTLNEENYTLSGLQISAIECMPQEVLKVLNASQLSAQVAIRLKEGKYNMSELQRSAVEEYFVSPFDSINFDEKENASTPRNETEEEEDVPVDEGDQSESKADKLCHTVLYLLMFRFLIFLK